MVVSSIGSAQPRRRGGGSRHPTARPPAREACVRGDAVDRLWNSSATPSAWEITPEGGVCLDSDRAIEPARPLGRDLGT